MPIAKTKKELLEAIETEYRLLRKCIESLDVRERELPGVCHEWSAKDVMAHLVEWKKMFLGWYARMLELTRSISQEKLFCKQLYPWLRVWPLARWIAAQTSSHYRWARTRIRRAANRRRAPVLTAVSLR